MDNRKKRKTMREAKARYRASHPDFYEGEKLKRREISALHKAVQAFCTKTGTNLVDFILNTLKEKPDG